LREDLIHPLASPAAGTRPGYGPNFRKVDRARALSRHRPLCCSRALPLAREVVRKDFLSQFYSRTANRGRPASDGGAGADFFRTWKAF
jgi:hypothetical protein